MPALFERRDFRDPELADAQITVTEVRVGADLKRAIAFVARLGRSDVDALLPALSAPRRSCVAKWRTRYG